MPGSLARCFWAASCHLARCGCVCTWTRGRRWGVRAVAPAGAAAGVACAPGGTLSSGEGARSRGAAVVTGVSDRDTLEGGSCAVDFTCYDPVAYGARPCTGTELEVLGTWPTLPVMTLTAAAGPAVKVTDGGGRYVLVERDLSAGDEVVMDFAAESVTVGGEDASADVGVGSTFFSLPPGAHALTFFGCSAHEVAWTERWL
ncbi:MAG: phage distal tail protein [Eggerthella lenta]